MSQLIQGFVELYSDFKKESLANLAQIYSDEVDFIDPIHRIQGLSELEQYFSSIMSGVEECRFDNFRTEIGELTSSVEWQMHFRHRRLGSKLITVNGVSLLEHQDKIERHRDYYDMGEMIYEHVPIMGALVRNIKGKLAK